MHWYLLLSLGSTKLHRKLCCRLLPISNHCSDFISLLQQRTELPLCSGWDNLHRNYTWCQCSIIPNHPQCPWSGQFCLPISTTQGVCFPEQVHSSTTVSFDSCKDALNCRLYLLPRYLKKGISKCAWEAHLKGRQHAAQHKQTQSYQRTKWASTLSPQATFRWHKLHTPASLILCQASL